MAKIVEFTLPSGSSIGGQPGYVWVYLDGEHYTASFWREDQVTKAVDSWKSLGFEAKQRSR